MATVGGFPACNSAANALIAPIVRLRSKFEAVESPRNFFMNVTSELGDVVVVDDPSRMALSRVLVAVGQNHQVASAAIAAARTITQHSRGVDHAESITQSIPPGVTLPGMTIPTDGRLGTDDSHGVTVRDMDALHDPLTGAHSK